MYRSLDKVSKILTIESQNQYNNHVIIGGFEKLLPNLLPELNKDNVPDTLITSISDTFSIYSESSPEDREQLVGNLSIQIEKITSQKIKLVKLRKVEGTTTKTAFTVQIEIDRKKPAHNHLFPAQITPKIQSTTGLDANITALENVGVAKAAEFHQLGVFKIRDLFYLFPRRYDDYSKLKPINRLEYNEQLTIIATVQSVLSTKMRNKEMSRVEVVVSDGTGFLRLVFFRGSKYIRSFEAQFPHGRQLVISGKTETYLGRLQMNNPNIEDLDQAHLNTNGIIPVYPLTAKLSQKYVRTIVNNTINYYVNKVQDFLSPSIKRQCELVDLPVALHQVHFPQSSDLLESAQKRLAFDEIFLLQLGVLQQKRNWISQPATQFFPNEDQLTKFTGSLPFTLTKAQNKVIDEVTKNLSSGSPMNRLLQGDVGSGKTVIAAYAIACIAKDQAQSAVMAPTSILAEQHYRSLRSILGGIDDTTLAVSESEIRLLTGDTPAKEREEIKLGLLDGSIKLLIGTHALIEEPIQFLNLQLVVIDEQHRFGVSQRALLRQKGTNPHLLVMSATPIPRSLALTIYGDLDLSIMDEMPVGRKPVDTHILSPRERERGYQVIRNHLKQGHQAFIVYPLIESEENGEVKAVINDHEVLQKEIFPALQIGLLHGRLSPDEKDKIMMAFHDKKYSILVSTTVIEVGVDVPNATVMMIEGANRFGLAQLHQLRGRVGRSHEQSVCLLIPENEDAIENERLSVMIETSDGFLLAEKDLQQRGPGDFIGYRQSGFADLKMAKITDVRLIEKARTAAEMLFADDPQLEKSENALLLQKLQSFWNSDGSDIS
jgi:ATP-dependent DNA helicase RecG